MCALATTLILVLLQPYFYTVLPSDFNRHLVLQNYFDTKGESEKAEIVILGDSRSMFGIDSRIIKSVLKTSGEVYNLSSVSQDMYESGYYYNRIKDGTQVVIQCTTPLFFMENYDPELSNSKAISMFLSGYRIDPSTKELLPSYNEVFDRNKLLNYYDSRTYFRSYIHNYLRPLFDDEKYDEESRSSLYFPHHYTQEKLPTYSSYVVYNCDGYQIKESPQSQMQFVSTCHKLFHSRNIQYMIVLMPVNPDVCDQATAMYREIAQSLRQMNNLPVIDLSTLLEAEHFYDRTHANKAGAQIISKELARRIDQWYDRP